MDVDGMLHLSQFGAHERPVVTLIDYVYLTIAIPLIKLS